MAESNKLSVGDGHTASTESQKRSKVALITGITGQVIQVMMSNCKCWSEFLEVSHTNVMGVSATQCAYVA
jgi:hypothetical protein